MNHITFRRRILAVSLPLLLSLFAAACGDDASTDAAAPTTRPTRVSPTAVVSSGATIAVEGPGSGDGAKKFCAGGIPIANACRLFKDEEIEVCEANGTGFPDAPPRAASTSVPPIRRWPAPSGRNGPPVVAGADPSTPDPPANRRRRLSRRRCRFRRGRGSPGA